MSERPETGAPGASDPRHDAPGEAIEWAPAPLPQETGTALAVAPGAGAGLVLASRSESGPGSGVLAGDPPPELALALVDGGRGAELLHDAGPEDVAEPARLYLASLNTPRSRATAVEAFRRVARVLRVGTPGDPDGWQRVPWASLTARETTFVQATLLGELAPVTVRLTMSMLRGVLRQAFRLGRMTSDSYHRTRDTGPIKAERVPKGRMLSADEIARLRAHLATLAPPFGVQASALFALGLGGGLRRDELSGLAIDALADDDRNLRVMGKGQRERIQPLPAWAGASARSWLTLRATLGAKASTMFLVLGRSGRLTDTPLSVWAVWSLITSVGRQAGLRAFTPHDLRRTFASTLLDTSDLSTVQTLMRHKSPTTTALYDKRGSVHAARALDALDAWGEPVASLLAPRVVVTDAPDTSIDAAALAARLGDAFYRDPTSGKPLVQRRRKPTR